MYVHGFGQLWFVVLCGWVFGVLRLLSYDVVSGLHWLVCGGRLLLSGYLLVV